MPETNAEICHGCGEDCVSTAVLCNFCQDKFRRQGETIDKQRETIRALMEVGHDLSVIVEAHCGDAKIVKRWKETALRG